MFASVVSVNFVNETRSYINQEICKVDNSQLFNTVFIRKGMVMSGINEVRRIKIVALFVEKRHVIGWYAKINE